MAFDGIYEFGPQFLNAFPAALTSIFRSGNKTAFDKTIAGYHAAAEAANTASQFRWFIDQGTWSFATPSAFDWLTQLQSYTLEDVVDKIRGPVFVGDSASDTVFAGQAAKLAGKLVPNCVMFMPKKDVTKFNGMKIKANLVNLATLVAVSVDLLASRN
ncbi:hypothetical protein IFR05_006459 [Cadophora sp. M221]|nr:hypothetical protein IFR05_006459 [Cadophora sp. M221]